MGAFVISKKVNGDFKFEFTSRKGKTIFTSSGYPTSEDCENAIAKVKKIAEEASCVKFKASSGKFFFRLMIDGQVMATSRKYTTILMLEKGIKEIVQYVSISEVLDFSKDDFVFPDVSFSE